MKVRSLMVGLGVASVVSIGTVANARADEWFMLSQQTLKAADQSTEIKAEKGKMFKEDIKQTRLSVEGADVEISKVVLHWNNAPDDTAWNVGTIKAGGQTAAKSAPGHEGTLGSVTVQYKILNNATSAKLK